MAANETEITDTPGTSACSYQFGRFSLHVAGDASMSLVSDGHAVGLTTGELTILRVLLENRGQFVKTKVLLDCVTQSPRASENIVHGAVRELRRTLHDAELIKTERTRGYCFTGEVRIDAGDSFDQNPITVDVLPAATSAPKAERFAASEIQSVLPTDRRRDRFLMVALLVSTAVL